MTVGRDGEAETKATAITETAQTIEAGIGAKVNVNPTMYQVIDADALMEMLKEHQSQLQIGQDLWWHRMGTLGSKEPTLVAMFDERRNASQEMPQ